MFSLTSLALLSVAGAVALYWWQSGDYKGRARDLATRHCAGLGLQLLDQSMVITGLWPTRGADGRLGFRRRYQFEFTSTGARRYQGRLTLIGKRLGGIELEAYQLPGSE